MRLPPADPFAPIEIAAPDGGRARVLPHGAHVVSWTPAGGERLFVSARSHAAPGVAVRGGIPVIFPQFASEGPLPKHGFARTAAWELVGTTEEGAAVTLRLVDTPATRAVWPHAFAAELTARVSPGALDVALRVTNTGDDALAFTAALHTYLRVADVREASVEGLRGVRYRDSAAGGVERVDDAPAVRVAGEVDRVYMDAPPSLLVRDDAGGLSTRVSTEGFPDVVVWNPWAERARALDDMEPDGWLRMLCVEAAVVARPVRLAPGEAWLGRQRLAVAVADGEGRGRA
jgi:glucose-6-phosphate 1-epimerase